MWKSSQGSTYQTTPVNYAVPYLNLRPRVIEGHTQAYEVTGTQQSGKSVQLTLTNHTLRATSVHLMTATYDKSGKILGIQTMITTLDSSQSKSLNVPYTATAREVRAFVLSAYTLEPLCEVWTQQVNN